MQMIKKKGLESNLQFTFYVIWQVYNVGDHRLLDYISTFNSFVDFSNVRNDLAYGWLITYDMP